MNDRFAILEEVDVASIRHSEFVELQPERQLSPVPAMLEITRLQHQSDQFVCRRLRDPDSDHDALLTAKTNRSKEYAKTKHPPIGSQP